MTSPATASVEIDGVPWRPASFLTRAQLVISWRQLVAICDQHTRPADRKPGISYRQEWYLLYGGTAHVLQCRDEAGRVIGVLLISPSNKSFAMTHPKRRRQGVYTALLRDAERRGLWINVTANQYTRAGWRARVGYLRKSRPARPITQARRR
jgi:hypothetical protein